MKSPDLKIGRFKDFDVANNNVKVNLSRKHGIDIVGLYIYILWRSPYRSRSRSSSTSSSSRRR